MGRKHRRNTAKTGDKALYKSRQSSALEAAVDTRQNDSDDDGVYDKADRFYNQRDAALDQDYLELATGVDGRGIDGNHSDDEITQHEAVMDLGGGGVSSDSEEEDADEDDKSEGDQKMAAKKLGVPVDESSSSSSSSSDEEEEKENVRDWGSKKSVYYHGDTADLEIGQEQEDAFVEEEAAAQVQMARLQEMSEQDFLLSDDEGEDDGKTSKKQEESLQKQGRDISKWTTKEQQTYLEQHHGEFLPLVRYFTDVVQDFDQRTNVVVRAFYEQEAEPNAAKIVGATKEGERYLLSRALVQSSAALNLAIYMLLKSDYVKQQSGSGGGDSSSAAFMNDKEDDIMNSHPVLDHLQKLNTFAEKMEQTLADATLQEQMNNLVRAATLLASGEVQDEEEGSQSDDDSSLKEEGKHALADEEGSDNRKPEAVKQSTMIDEEESSSSDDDESLDEDTLKTRQATTLVNEARFALRPDEVFLGVDAQLQTKKRRRRASLDFGETPAATNTGQARRSLAVTVNSLEQRLAVHKSVASKKAAADQADQLDDFLDDDGDNEVRRGLELMEAELGRASDKEGNDNSKSGNDNDSEIDDANDFYNQIQKASKSKKKQRKEHYAVAPKFPRLEPDLAGERAIDRQILKNRGLVPHKNKLNRNPRAKKREQYRKALIRRKGAVRAMRDVQEGHVYGGEETGIKSNVRRSRNLT